mgnify:CR=1 FL=1
MKDCFAERDLYLRNTGLLGRIKTRLVKGYNRAVLNRIRLMEEIDINAGFCPNRVYVGERVDLPS